ncbi:hypothetical protein HAX54_037089 [Datura stramonium]|uniref:Uncharacterized protein n=1 Tax=Datura stramonium TaxID=4076 RepID=A0ABS8SH04_DATST|nr:hypothetical protein [Datura stramonium]
MNQAAETYDKDELLVNILVFMDLELQLGGKALDGRFLVICLENLRRGSEVEIKFPKSSGSSNLPENYFDTESRMKELKWKRARVVEDLQREQTLLDHAKFNFEIKKQEFVKFLHSSSYVTAVIN